MHRFDFVFTWSEGVCVCVHTRVYLHTYLFLYPKK